MLVWTNHSTLGRWLLLAAGVAVILYGALVMAFAATSPDLGFRCLLEDDVPPGTLPGPQIKRLVPSMRTLGVSPREGDVLLEVGGETVSSFMSFTRRLIELRNLQVGPEAEWPLRDSPGDSSAVGAPGNLPPVLTVGGEPWVQLKYARLPDLKPGTCWVALQTLPAREVLLSFVWFVLEFGIFLVGAMAFWQRPFDHSARLFFAMCIVSIGAFVGGYHWWIIAGNVWLLIPFVVCAMLLPVVTFHFFLSYPRPHPVLNVGPRASRWLIYGIPVACTALLVGIILYSSWIYEHGASTLQIQEVLRLIRQCVYGYLVVAVTFFMGTLVALVNSFVTTRNPILHNQVKWILWAGLVATVPVGYTLYLAQFDKVGFALGDASIPMFTASLLFMLAYVIGIVRFKLMLVEQILSRGMWYYTTSFAVSAGYNATVASVCLLGLRQSWRTPQQWWALGLAVMFCVIVLSWLRDTLQQMVDRQFYREKYQLDKALQRMNLAASQLVEPRPLAELMLASCRDVLGVDQAALYLRDGAAESLQLVATEGMNGAPLQLTLPAEALRPELLEDDPPDLAPEFIEHRRRARDVLTRLRVTQVHLLEAAGEVTGIVLLGTKRSGVAYSAEDLTFLTALGQITGVALQSARVQQAVNRLNDDLRLKGEKISEQQRLISMLQDEITGRQEIAPAAGAELEFRRDAIKGNSASIRGLLETVKKVSLSASSVLIRGESGTGKELLAKAIHENGPRRAGPLVSVHCGALSPTLLESELFGHVKGSFTGAHRDRPGRFELAHNGTLFLDEIGDISLDTQIKLLRVLQERSFEPVGGSRAITVDVRLIAATHQDLEALIAAGRFREDLFYRLNVISLKLPALRERGDDVFELALHFLMRSALRAGKPVTQLSDEVLAAFRAYHWPGNVRELENAIESALVLAEEPSIRLQDLPPHINGSRARRPVALEAKPSQAGSSSGARPGADPGRAIATKPSSPVAERAAPPMLAGRERDRLVEALRKADGNKSEAARLLRMPRSTFFSKLRKHRIG